MAFLKVMERLSPGPVGSIWTAWTSGWPHSIKLMEGAFQIDGRRCRSQPIGVLQVVSNKIINLWHESGMLSAARRSKVRATKPDPFPTAPFLVEFNMKSRSFLLATSWVVLSMVLLGLTVSCIFPGQERHGYYHGGGGWHDGYRG
jgi:hypothetical protein